MFQTAVYKTSSVTTLPPGGIIVQLYEGAIKYLNQAIMELEAGRFAEKGQKINRAIAIIEELDVSLNMDVEGDIPINLHRLYTFMIDHLNQANLAKDSAKIRNVINLLRDLNQAWRAIAD